MRPSLIIALALGLVLGGAPAQGPTRQPVSAQEEASLHGYGESNTACREWSDGCRTCSRSGAGEAAVCSNIGIACQPKMITCVNRAEPPK